MEGGKLNIRRNLMPREKLCLSLSTRRLGQMTSRGPLEHQNPPAIWAQRAGRSGAPKLWNAAELCLVSVQSNKSLLTEITLHLDQVCRNICQGSATMFRANVETRCTVPFRECSGKSTYTYRRFLTCCSSTLLGQRWGRSRSGACVLISSNEFIE